MFEAQDRPSRADVVECFEATLKGVSQQSLHNGREEELFQDLCFWAKQRPCLRGFHVFKIGMMTEFFQIAGMSTLATERLKSPVRKAILTGKFYHLTDNLGMELPLGSTYANIFLRFPKLFR